jgi:hypothetical protein
MRETPPTIGLKVIDADVVVEALAGDRHSARKDDPELGFLEPAAPVAAFHLLLT